MRQALADLHHARAALGVVLLTITVHDPARGLCACAHSSHPVDYPVQGTKPLTHDAWHDQVITRRETFVANTPTAFEKVFLDHALMGDHCCAALAEISPA